MQEFPSITPSTINEKEALIAFIPLAEMVARKEMKTLPPALADFKELVNIGLIKINSLLQEAHNNNKTYNPSYIIQGITWEIKNKTRKEATQRGEFKTSAPSPTEQSNNGYSLQDVQEAVLETVISYEANSFEIADDNAVDPLEDSEFNELKAVLRQGIALLPDNYRQVIEMRFYQGLKGVQIAERLGISSARVTRIVQDSIGLLRERLLQKKFL